MHTFATIALLSSRDCFSTERGSSDRDLERTNRPRIYPPFDSRAADLSKASVAWTTTIAIARCRSRDGNDGRITSQRDDNGRKGKRARLIGRRASCFDPSASLDRFARATRERSSLRPDLQLDLLGGKKNGRRAHGWGKSHIGPGAHAARTHRASLVSGHLPRLTASRAARGQAGFHFSFPPESPSRPDPRGPLARRDPLDRATERGCDRASSAPRAFTLHARTNPRWESRVKSGEKSVGTLRSDDVCYLLLFCHETAGAE